MVACPSMLSADEKQLLYWLARDYVPRDGLVIDAGCFLGGSTLALLAGLSAAPAIDGHRAAPFRRLHSFDRFIADDYMRRWYLDPNGLRLEGDRFRHIFDRHVSAYAPALEVHDGDVTATAWPAQPIALLFIDICKSWTVNDHCTRTWFPHLVAGQAIVVQQDFFHHLEYWVVLTQELLSPYFQYLGCVRWNSAVFRAVAPVPPDAIPPRLRDLGLERLDALFERHLGRYSAPYELDMLRCARAFLHLDFGERALPDRVLEDVSARQRGEFAFAQTLADLSDALAGR